MKAIKYFSYFAHIHNILGGLLIVPAVIVFLISSSAYSKENTIVILFSITIAVLCIIGSLMTLSINKYPIGVTILATLTALQIFSFSVNHTYVNINIVPTFGFMIEINSGTISDVSTFFNYIPHAVIDSAHPAKTALGINIVPLFLFILFFPFYQKLKIEVEELLKKIEEQKRKL
ncbi:MAG: hypothetical protein PF637_10775 [Spirochaetes bacterium]|jgi:hypothetical protein|nr:hypothetical protein [Spirochaetota bacterium]